MRDPRQVFARYGRQLLVPGAAFHGQAALHGWAAVFGHDGSPVAAEAAAVAARYLVGAGLGRVAIPQAQLLALADLDPEVQLIDGPGQAVPPAAHFFFAQRGFGMTVDVVRLTSADTSPTVCTLRWDVGHPAGTVDAVAVGAAAAGLLLDDVFELAPLPSSLCWDWTDPVLPRLSRKPQPPQPVGTVRADAALQGELLADAGAMLALQHECLTRAPAEACGLLVRNGAGRLEVVPTKNLQDERHVADPDRHPRTSRTAWQLDTRVVAQLAEQGRSLVAFWHSHVDTDARFSADDLAGAAPDGQPLYPGVAHVVVAVIAGNCSEVKVYRLEG